MSTVVFSSAAGAAAAVPKAMVAGSAGLAADHWRKNSVELSPGRWMLARVTVYHGLAAALSPGLPLSPSMYR